MFSVTEGRDSPEMDFLMPLVLTPLWEKKKNWATVYLFLQMYVTHPAQLSDIYERNESRIPPPRNYDLGSHMVTAALESIPCFFTNSCSTPISDEQLKHTHIQSLGETANDLSRTSR